MCFSDSMVDIAVKDAFSHSPAFTDPHKEFKGYALIERPHLTINLLFIFPIPKTWLASYEHLRYGFGFYTNPRNFHQIAATATRIIKRIGVATAPTLVKSDALK